MLFDPFPWTSPSESALPTATNGYFDSINPTYSIGLISTLNDAFEQVATETRRVSLYLLSQKIRGAEASLTIIANQIFLATAKATDSATRVSVETSISSTYGSNSQETAYPSIPTVESDVLAKIAATNIMDAENAIFNASINLNELHWQQNVYKMYINKGANLFFFGFFIVAFVAFIAYMLLLKYWYFSTALYIGCGLEFAGYSGRFLSVGNYSNVNTFLLQLVCLTLGPAFIVAGIYYLIGYLSLIYGPHLSPLRPRWYSYIFLACDGLSLLLQAVGGGLAATGLKQHTSVDAGTHIMVAGIGFQVLSMSLFIALYFWFLHRVHFGLSEQPFPPTLKNWIQLVILNLKVEELDHLWEPTTSNIRRGKWFKYNQLAIMFSILCLYIRCVYRVVELSEGWRGYLITHEKYILTLDGMMIMLTVLTFLIFHPFVLFGKKQLGLFEFKKDELAVQDSSEADLEMEFQLSGEKPQISESEVDSKLKLKPKPNSSTIG